jgi:hypothetical protein
MLRFLITIMRGFEKIFFDPSYVPMRFFAATPGRERAVEQIFFAGFACFTSYCRVTGPQNKTFIKNQLTLLYTVQYKRVGRLLTFIFIF